MNEDQAKVADDIAQKMATFMMLLTTRYKGHEMFVAEMLTNSLCGYVSIAARTPKEALRQVARKVLKFNYSEIRAQHFGYKTLKISPDRLAKGIVPLASVPNQEPAE
jgi:hypothetical protein